jgi:hypothetical protein
MTHLGEAEPAGGCNQQQTQPTQIGVAQRSPALLQRVRLSAVDGESGGCYVSFERLRRVLGRHKLDPTPQPDDVSGQPECRSLCGRGDPSRGENGPPTLSPHAL